MPRKPTYKLAMKNVEGLGDASYPRFEHLTRRKGKRISWNKYISGQTSHQSFTWNSFMKLVQPKK